MGRIRLAIIFPPKITNFNGLDDKFLKSYPDIEVFLSDINSFFGSDLASTCLDGFNYKDNSETTKIFSSHVLNSIFYSILKANNIKPEILFASGLGIYSALFASGSITFNDSNLLIKTTVDNIVQIPDDSKKAYAEILGLDEKKLASLVQKYFSDSELAISHYNASNRFIVSGKEESLKKLIELSKGMDGLCDSITLAGYLTHTNFLKLSSSFKKSLNNITFNNPQIPAFLDTEAGLFNSGNEIKMVLTDLISKPVLFEKSIRLLIAQGINYFLELGGGGRLSYLIKWIDRKTRTCCVEDNESLGKALKLLK